VASRYEWHGDDDTIPVGLWLAGVRRSVQGKRGQAILVELEQALEALPQKRLTKGALAQLEDFDADVPKPTGDVCLVGALALHREVKKGKSVDEALMHLADLEDGYPGADGTAEVGAAMGMSRSMAWHLGWVNDEMFMSASPEERYERVLAWVRLQRRKPGEGIYE
jgi:hypothetical protein